MATIELKNLAFTYNKNTPSAVCALDHVSLTIDGAADGITGLIGWVAGENFMQGFHTFSAEYPVATLWVLDMLTVTAIWGIGRLCALRRQAVPGIRIAGNFLLILIGCGVFQIALFGIAQLRDAHIHAGACTEQIQKK